MKKDTLSVSLAHSLWTARRPLSERRRYLKQMAYGEQWQDTVLDLEGRPVNERDQMVKEGMQPLTNNLIRRLVKTIVGRYRDLAEKSGDYDTSPGSIDTTGQHDELDSRLLEEFLISGQAIQRVADDNPVYGFRPTVENVSPDSFFVNDFRDPRGYDVEVVGMLHDMSPGEFLTRFAGNSPKRTAILNEEIRKAVTEQTDIDGRLSFAGKGLDTTDFRTPTKGHLRVIELWTREYVPAPAIGSSRELTDTLAALGNRPRKRRTTGRFVWQARWLTPDGLVLDRYVSPWSHGSHPFVFKLYPLIDGEIHPFVEDLVGQQRHINRLIVLIDKVMASSAKGVLLFPMKQLPKKITIEEVARSWASPSGIIPITGESGPLPQQIVTQGGDSQAHHLLEIELKLFQEASGVNEALSGGVLAGVKNGAELYRQQVDNATIALADILKTFKAVTDARTGIIKELTA